jgi:hypothetical protein
MTFRKQEQAVEALLGMYRLYQAATADEKAVIADQMLFADPVVWMLYKYEAYKGTVAEIATWGDLVQHSEHHDGICKKRLQFIRASMLTLTHQDVLDGSVIDPQQDIRQLVVSNFFEPLLQNQEHMTNWSTNEYFTMQGKAAKWECYTAARTPVQDHGCSCAH